MSLYDHYDMENRRNVAILPNVRQFRLALGLSLEEAAMLLDEHHSLVFSQEDAGLKADELYVEAALGEYLEAARAVVEEDRLPPALTAQRVSSLYHLRNALGLSIKNAALVQRTSMRIVELREDASKSLPAGTMQHAWRTYVDWAVESCDRSRTHANQGSTDRRPAPRDPFADLDQERERTEIGRLANPSPAEARAFVLRFLA
jgi:hypothetical protein